MKMLNRFVLICSTALLCSASSARATVVVYDVDALLSSLTLSGTFAGQMLSEQSAGSMFDFWDGTIVGNLVGNTLSFAGGSDVRAVLHPSAPFVPSSGGVGNYGVQVVAFGAVAAYRDLAFDFTTGSVTSGAAPAGSGVTVLSGAADYFLPPSTSGISSLLGKTAANQAAGLTSLSLSGSVETLTLPVSITFTSSNGLVQNFSGNLVATRPVPEPSSVGLLLCGVAAIARRRRSPVEADSR